MLRLLPQEGERSIYGFVVLLFGFGEVSERGAVAQ
jgi:hypothetical protein